MTTLDNTLNIGDLCVWCGDDTAFGSGKFVNRITVYTDIENTTWGENIDIELENAYTHVEGYGCEECYEGEEID